MRIIFFSVLCCVAFVPYAFANSTLQPPFKDMPQHNWTGYYTGILLGGQFGRSSNKTGSFGYNANNNEWDYSESGANVGVEFGYSYPWYHLFVGPEVELGYLNMNGRGAQPDSPASDTIGKTDSNFYTALRARIGADFDHYLLFATGGAIGVNYNKQVVDSCNIAPCGGGTVSAKTNDFVFGYIVGVGAEHLLAKNWSVKFETLYFNLNNESFIGKTNLGNTYRWTGQTSGLIVRGGLDCYF